jgi:type II secretory pathway predicted ATPase ExeA
MTRMLSEVMAYYGFTRDVRHLGYFETTQHQHIMAALKAAIQQGQLVALSGIVGCGKTRTLQRLQELLGREHDIVMAKSLAIDKDRVHLGTLLMALFYDLATEKDVTMPTQPEKRERKWLELVPTRRKTIALFIDEAHDLHSRTLWGLKRLMELVRASGGSHSVVLAGHPKLTNDLRRPAIEEIGSRAVVFRLEGVKGQQRAYITWLLEQCAATQATEARRADEEAGREHGWSSPPESVCTESGPTWLFASCWR